MIHHPPKAPIFYGWWMVAACMTFATVCWSLGTFGMSVYVHVLSQTDQGAARFAVGTVATGVTVAYLVSAAMMAVIGGVVARCGTRPLVGAGAGLLALAVLCLAHSAKVWQLYAAFGVLGLGMSCLSTVAIGSTLAPWFNVHQGRAVSTAMLGASLGGIVGTPLLMWGIAALGFKGTAWVAAGVSLGVIVPLAVWVMRRRPQDMGLHPDGLPPAPVVAGATPEVAWRRADAVRTPQFQSQVLAFGLALMVQVGFLSHHVSLAQPLLGDGGAALAVTASAVAAFVGRLLLARFADRIDVRKTAAAILVFAAVTLVAMAALPSAPAMMALSVAYGLTVGNITTLPPIIMRREFGALSFGTVFGLGAMLTAVMMAMGPTVFGSLRQWTGGYTTALVLSALLNLVAVAALLWGGRKPLRNPAALKANF